VALRAMLTDGLPFQSETVLRTPKKGGGEFPKYLSARVLGGINFYDWVMCSGMGLDVQVPKADSGAAMRGGLPGMWRDTCLGDRKLVRERF
jgi:hypothetical protein